MDTTITTNHYGKWVTSDNPITGVLNSNDINWDSMQWENEICLNCENAYSEIENDDSLSEEDKENAMQYVECFEHDKLYGKWLQDDDGLYYPDETGDFSAIYNGNAYTLQVVYSKFTAKCNLCSPCYPGQGDLSGNGDYLAYTLPDYLLYKDNNDCD